MTNNEIILGGVSLVSSSIATVLAWKMGGKQRAKNENSDAITIGTDRIVESSNKLIERMELMLEKQGVQIEQEQKRVQIEKEHREMCETELKKHEAMIANLMEEIEKLKSAMN